MYVCDYQRIVVHNEIVCESRLRAKSWRLTFSGMQAEKETKLTDRWHKIMEAYPDEIAEHLQCFSPIQSSRRNALNLVYLFFEIAFHD